MGTQNRDQTRQSQAAAGQKTAPQDPKLNPGRDEQNQIEQRTSDQGQGRNQSASGDRSSSSRDSRADTSAPNASGGSKSIQRPTGEERWQRIAEAAYRRAEHRGFAPGNEVEDWLAAEHEVDSPTGAQPKTLR